MALGKTALSETALGEMIIHHEEFSQEVWEKLTFFLNVTISVR
jgi:hypothetical protein